MSTDALASEWAKALSEDRKQFDMVIDKMFDGFAYHKIVVDNAGKPVDYVFLEVNHAFEKMTGLKRAHIIGKKVTKVLPGIEKDSADWIGIYGEVALMGKPIQFENHATSLDKWYKVSAYCPQKGYFVALFEDITERKKTEAALKEAKKQTEFDRKRLETILETTPSAVVIIDAQSGKFSYVNKRAVQLYGFDTLGLGLDENVAKVKARRADGTVYPIEQMPVSRSLKFGQEVRNEEMIIERADGQVLPIIASTAPLRDMQGNITAAIVVFEDITERKKAEDALNASEKKANDLIKYAPSGIYELDYRIPPKFRSVNDSMCQILDYTREELLAISPFALLDDESQMRFRERIIKMLAGEKVDDTVEFKVIPKDGREIYAVLNVSFTYKDGKPDGALVVAHDITERRKAEKELEKRAENLENLVEERTKALRDSERLAAIGATAGMVGHDIRNPLQAITSDVFLAKSELASVQDSEEKKNAIESLVEIEKNIDYINKIVQDLQDYARPLSPQAEEADIKSIVDKLLTKNGLPKNIKVNVKVEDAARKINADSYYLNRILYNLITNSVQAMPEGGKLIIQAYKEDSDLVLTVMDTGIGIPKAIQSKMFTAMFTTKSKGQGFGLPVVKRMTESLGGTVTFESDGSKGTTFTVRLPQKVKL